MATSGLAFSGLLGRATAYGALALVLTVGGALAQNVAADSVTENGSPTRWGHSSCQATLAQLSDGNISNPGVCYVPPLPAGYTQTYTFSPANDVFMTGIDIWSNAGSSMTDNELRRLDVAVDYFDPSTNSTQTITLNDVNIGDTITFDDPKFVSLGSNLYRVSEVRLSEMVGTSATGRVTFREVQGVFATLPVAPDIVVSSSESGSISDGAPDAQGVEPTGVAKTVTYTITNEGTDVLTFGGAVTLSGLVNVTDASVSAPGAASLAPGESTTISVAYTPVAAGDYSFDVAIPSNDPDEAPFDIAVVGTANEVPSVSLTADAGPPGGPYPITATFSEDVSGFEVGDFVVTNGTVSGFTNPSTGVYEITVTAIDPTQPVSVSIPEGVATDTDGAPNVASNVLTFDAINAPTPDELTVVGSIIRDETLRDMRDSLAFNQRAQRGARDRHAAYLRCLSALEEDRADGKLADDVDYEPCTATRALSVEPSFEGKLSMTGESVTSNGRFYSEQVSHDGTKRRLAFGEFSVNRYEDGGTTAHLNGRIAWERAVGADTLKGYFIGARAVQSDIKDDFSGTRTGFGVNAGAYFVDQIRENLFWDGFVAVGLGRNDLELDNGFLVVEGDYATTSLEFGLALSGVREFERFDLYPELSFAYGITDVGDADLTSTGPGGSSSTTLEVGRVELGTLRFRPEFVFAGQADAFGVSYRSLSVAPSLLCEVVRTEARETECGGGLEVAWTARSKDGHSAFTARASREVVGGSERDQIAVSFERNF